MDLREVREFINDTFKYVLVAGIVIFLFVFVIRILQVSGPSMSPNLKDTDIIVINKFVYRFKDIKRGDVIVLSVDDKYMVKRVIGLPGDSLKIIDGRVYLNNELFDDYVDIDILEAGNLEKGIIVPENEYFVLGDNRNDSEDSRFYGTVMKENILGRVWFRLYPFNKIKFIK